MKDGLIQKGRLRAAGAPLRRILFFSLVGCSFAFCAGALAQNSSPQRSLAVDLLPGEIRLIGYDEPAQRAIPLAAATTIPVYFELLPQAGNLAGRNLIVAVDGIDAARLALPAVPARPGAVLKFEAPIRIPRYAPLGKAEVTCGIIPSTEPGESGMRGQAARMGPLGTLELLPATPTPDLDQAAKDALWAQAKAANSIVRNGGFELGLTNWDVSKEILEGAAGWRSRLQLAIDFDVSIEGEQALRIDFAGGQDVDFYHVRQTLNAKPSTTYQLSYFVKTQDLSSKTGPVVAVTDPDQPLTALYAQAPPAMRPVGTQPWQPVSVTFTTLGTTTRLRLILRRYGSGAQPYNPEKFGAIGGSVWLDGIQLVELP